MREARHAARSLLATIAGGPTRAFGYKARGTMAGIGHLNGVAEIFGVPLWGLPAWFLWRAYYLAQMPTLGRKLRLFVEWTWGMFFPTDITHLHFARSHAHDDERERAPEADAPQKERRPPARRLTRVSNRGIASTIHAGDVATVTARPAPSSLPAAERRCPSIVSIIRGEFAMPKSNRGRVSAAPSVLLASLLALAFVTPALAGECPADKVGANPLAGAATAPVGVTEMELSSIDLSKESVNLPQRRLRYRHMEIAPGGVVPLHTHADRPALIMVNQGQIYEYSSQCTVPILHKAGEIGRESNGLSTGGRTKAASPSC